MEILKPIKTPKNVKRGRETAEGKAIRELAIGATLPIRCDGAERRRIVDVARQAAARDRGFSIGVRYKDGILYIAKFARENGST